MNGRSMTKEDMHQFALVMLGEDGGLPHGVVVSVDRFRRQVSAHVKGRLVLLLSRRQLLACARLRGWK
jgi:hypothetical protein